MALAVAAETSVDRVLSQIVEGLVAATAVALARVWLIAPGDICATCPLRAECPDQTRCLHLSASAGAPLDGRADWSRLDGSIQTISPWRAEDRPHRRDRGRDLHSRRGPRSGLDRSPGLGASRAHRQLWRPAAGFRGEILGVLGVFNRDPCDRAHSPGCARLPTTRRSRSPTRGR